MNKKIIALLMTICMMITVFAGCGSESTATSNNKTDNKKITVTDMLGREVTLKNGVAKKVVCNDSSLRFYCYVGNVDKIAGVREGEKKGTRRRPYAIANPSLANLPTIGERGINYEKILELKPDVIFTSKTDKAIVDKMQEKTGIPVVAVSYGESAIFDPQVYSSIKLIGKVIGEEKRAKEVVDYMEKCKKDLNDRTKDVPEDKKSSAYAGALAWSGSHGIESTRENYPLFKALNAKNVVTGTGKTASVMVDKEKLLQWNPDKIFIDLSGLEKVKDDYRKHPDFYKTLKAFKDKEVYAQIPYVWCHINVDTAMADAYYIGKVLYPEQFKDVEPEKKADEIYKFLLGKELYQDMVKNDGGFRKITLEDLAK